MKQIKSLIVFLIVLTSGISLYSCANNNSKKSSESVEYQPDILNSDRVIKCYHLGGTANDILQGVHRAMPFGNILISQTGIIKAVQIQYSDNKIVWFKVLYVSINDNSQLYKCEITGKTFSNCADIVYKDLETLDAANESNREIRIFWN